ncbi:MAG: diaminopimelate decarboxylase [Planctomycetaceae bacterium]|nr:diaminopimelate decarboxylase [Planctomycetaceae bacterium]
MILEYDKHEQLQKNRKLTYKLRSRLIENFTTFPNNVTKIMTKELKHSDEFIKSLAEKYPTPFYLYDEKTLREHARLFNKAFAWNAGYKEYFAVKANPNPEILKILKSENLGFDCSSLAELNICERLGFVGEDIMFTSNDTPSAEYVKAKNLNAIINLDDITDIYVLEKCAGLPEVICFRWNPGLSVKVSSVIGNPVEAKYGLTTRQLVEAYRIAKAKGVKRFGLHTMIASNLLDEQFFLTTAKSLFDMTALIKKETGIEISFINMGGGFGVAYKPDQKTIDLIKLGQMIQAGYTEFNKVEPNLQIRLLTEAGRLVAAEAGVLVTRVIHRKDTYRAYIGVDASMANLMRPGMYGAYHHITVVSESGKKSNATQEVDVVGSLCENCDKFAVNRVLPTINIGDLLVIHDAGAHGYAMGFQYNGKLRCAELLLEESGNVRMIRRAETFDDYIATLNVNEW